MLKRGTFSYSSQITDLNPLMQENELENSLLGPAIKKKILDTHFKLDTH